MALIWIKPTKKYILKTLKSSASGQETVRFSDSPDFENFPDFRTGRDVR